ncbi:MAG: phytochelatin synthase family protein, partial [Elusimicrobia bacterium]|nr:phytochelatin synthase family protein [Elusimicrobiota bacterium]
LNSFYVPQSDAYSCGAASVSMALNALLNADRPRSDQERNITQEELLDKVKGDWQALLSPPGLAGRHGLTLTQLAAFMRAGFKAYSRDKFAVTLGEAGLKAFRRALVENEKDADDLILVHFAQDDLTLAEGGPYPHISPIGAYDAARKRVLIFDVDRQWYEPYWVPDEALLKAMARETAAFGRGGWVRARRDR